MTATLAPLTLSALPATRMLKPREVADYLCVDTKTLSNWRYLGRGPSFVKDGGIIRYRASDVDAYLATKRVATDA